MFLVSNTTPPFEALYALPPAVPSRPSILASVTTEPRSPSTRGCSIILATAALATRNVPVRVTAITRYHSARSSRWTGPPPATPAAWTTPSSRPGTAANTDETADSSVTSATTKLEPGAEVLVGRGHTDPDHSAALGQQSAGGGEADARRGSCDDKCARMRPARGARNPIR